MAAGTKRYSADLKRDAIAMVAELVAQGSSEWAAMKKTADLLRVGAAETVRAWVRKAPDGTGTASVVSADAQEEMRRLKRENAELKRANGTLKAAASFFAAEIDRPHR